MTLAETLQQKLSDWQPAEEGRQSWVDSSTESGWTIALSSDRTETLGCEVWELALTSKEILWKNAAELQARAEAIAARVTGLREPLRVIEVDRLRMEAMLRSDSPAQRSDRVSYYELRLVGAQNQMLLKRFDATPGQSNKREQVAFALTFEVIAKMIADLMTQ